MSADRKTGFIDLSTYDGPMTVVGYPDLSAIKLQHSEAQIPQDKTPRRTSQTHRGHRATPLQKPR